MYAKYENPDSGMAPDSSWRTAYHGTWFYSLRNVLYHGVLLESRNTHIGTVTVQIDQFLSIFHLKDVWRCLEILVNESMQLDRLGILSVDDHDRLGAPWQAMNSGNQVSMCRPSSRLPGNTLELTKCLMTGTTTAVC